MILLQEFYITKNDAGQRLDKFLRKAAPALPNSLLYKAIRKKDIKINGKPALGSVILVEGDYVWAYLHNQFFEKETPYFETAPPSIDVLYQDENILIADKPVGLLMHGGNTATTDTFTNRMLHYLAQNGDYRPNLEQSFTPAFCNRIDRNTRGLVIAAKNFSTLQFLNEQMRLHNISRKYLCVVQGTPKRSNAILTGYAYKEPNNNRLIVLKKPNSHTSAIQTSYQLLQTKEQFSLLEVQLGTGRSHQIRAHLASIGHPIVGDRKYGAAPFAKALHQQLVSYCLTCHWEPGNTLDYLIEKPFCLPTENMFPWFSAL